MRLAAQTTVLVTFVAGAALALAPSHPVPIGRAWVLGLALIWAVTLATSVSGAPSDRSSAPPLLWRRRRPPAVELPADLESLHLAVELALSSEFDRHYRLRPWLVETAAGLLATRRGVSLASDQARAAVLLGPELWELVRPERPEPPGRGRRELDPAELERMATALEALDRR